jgi:protein required for attachment to host cells
MKNGMKQTWIVVMDSSVAHFYSLHRDAHGTGRIDAVADEMVSHLHRHSRDLKSDEPGRGFRSAGSTARHGMEPPHDYHKLEKHDFVRAVAGALGRAHNAHKFERLVLVAPERSIGELRGELDEPVKKSVWREIGKDLVKLNDQELWARIGPELQEPPRPIA